MCYLSKSGVVNVRERVTCGEEFIGTERDWVSSERQKLVEATHWVTKPGRSPFQHCTAEPIKPQVQRKRSLINLSGYMSFHRIRL